ncbi:MAG: helix-turn-helix domain-containing protein [Bacillota bacterium]
MNQLGNRLRMLRNDRNLTLVDVAKAIGSTYQYLSALETGSRPNPSMDIIRRLATFYGVSLDYLVNGNEPTEKINTSPKLLKEWQRVQRYILILFGTDRKKEIRKLIRYLRDMIDNMDTQE